MNRIRDRVQVSASANGNSWTPLCGAYTKPGSWYQNTGEPVYEGRRAEWVQEEMSLNAFIGGDVRLRFDLTSDMDIARDGFWFDDLEVITTTDMITAIGDQTTSSAGPVCWPSPASDQVRVSLATPPQPGARLRLHDATGTVVMDRPITGNGVDLDVRHLPAGLYACVVSTPQGPQRVARLVVAR